MSVGNQVELFAKFIGDRRIVIADTSSAARTGLAKTMVGLGAKTANITLAPNYETGKAAIEKIKPDVVICDYVLGNSCGLDLLQTQRESNPESKKCLFVLVTGDTSQSTVAQAAEEDVDTFILKPYTIGALRQSIMKAAVAKIYPSTYMKTIEEGKELLLSGQVDQALETFAKAKTFDPKPSLAYFYYGQAELLKEALDPARDSFKNGLQHNKIHYKCMVGLFDVLMKQKQYEEAYDVVKRISRYFPANPQRLTQVLRLAVMTNSYEDIERYYQAFTGIDQRNDELIKYVCAALVVCGKYYLRQNSKSRALSLFQKAGLTASGRTRILREIITALVADEMVSESEEFLLRFPPDAQSGADYLAMKYLITDATCSDSKAVEMGRKVISMGVHDPLIYEVLIRRSFQAGLKDAAESLIHDASQRWPEKKAAFEKLAVSGTAPART